MTGSRIFGLILVIIGGVWLLNEFGIELFENWWPVILIGVGIYLVFNSRKRPCCNNVGNFNILGDTKRDSFKGPVDGTDISQFIGDADLNFSGAELATGVNRVGLSSFVGDIRIVIAPQTAVRLEASNAIGDIVFLGKKQDGVFQSYSGQSDGYDSAEKKLLFLCKSFAGDIRIEYSS